MDLTDISENFNYKLYNHYVINQSWQNSNSNIHRIYFYWAHLFLMVKILLGKGLLEFCFYFSQVHLQAVHFEGYGYLSKSLQNNTLKIRLKI